MQKVQVDQEIFCLNFTRLGFGPWVSECLAAHSSKFLQVLNASLPSSARGSGTLSQQMSAEPDL